MSDKKKTGGRVKGTPNKATAPVKDMISTLIESYATGIVFEVDEQQVVVSLMEDMKSVDAYQRLQIFAKLTDYVLPKQKSVEHKGDIVNGVFRIGYGDSATST